MPIAHIRFPLGGWSRSRLACHDSGVYPNGGIVEGVEGEFIVVPVESQSKAHNAIIAQEGGIGSGIVRHDMCGR